ncbi:SMI1/KNR4 family protein [Kitasatospora sp. NPDC057198]|uniref:SMI1/KNR4 family protein n=1 Tax=Kitasatospora sp. NPDC057198 TaxID=3346046 RepID=UPI00363E571F
MGLTAEQVARQIAAEVAAGAPEGWTHCVLAGYAGATGGHALSGEYAVPGRPDRLLVHLPDLARLGAVFGASHGWPATVLELTCRPSGAFDLVAFPQGPLHDLNPQSNWTLVLDPDHRPAEPGGTGADHPAVPHPSADPALAVERLHALLRQDAEERGEAAELRPPVTEERLAAVEGRLGRALPADLRALYREADGDGGREVLGGYAWLPIGRRADAPDSTPEPGHFDWRYQWDRVVFDAQPAHTVRRRTAHPGWIPIATTYDGDYIAVDLAPAAGGHHGQVIEIGATFEDGPGLLAPSVTAWLGQLLELPDAEPPDDERQQLVASTLDEGLTPRTQAVHLNDARSPVDLTPLAATRLRRLHLNGCATADLTPLAALPVEDLQVGLTAGADPAPLAGHPHLASLAVRADHPVDLAALRTLPALRALDLSGCPAADLAPLAGLPGLRYLALTGPQWGALAAAGRLPAGLAAARLAGGASLAEALDLLAALGTDTSAAVRLSGSR